MGVRCDGSGQHVQRCHAAVQFPWLRPTSRGVQEGAQMVRLDGGPSFLCSTPCAVGLHAVQEAAQPSPLTVITHRGMCQHPVCMHVSSRTARRTEAGTHTQLLRPPWRHSHHRPRTPRRPASEISWDADYGTCSAAGSLHDAGRPHLATATQARARALHTLAPTCEPRASPITPQANSSLPRPAAPAPLPRRPRAASRHQRRTMHHTRHPTRRTYQTHHRTVNFTVRTAASAAAAATLLLAATEILHESLEARRVGQT